MMSLENIEGLVVIGYRVAQIASHLPDVTAIAVCEGVFRVKLDGPRVIASSSMSPLTHLLCSLSVYARGMRCGDLRCNGETKEKNERGDFERSFIWEFMGCRLCRLGEFWSEFDCALDPWRKVKREIRQKATRERGQLITRMRRIKDLIRMNRTLPITTRSASSASHRIHKYASRFQACTVERVKGIEPSYSAWEAAVQPLNYTRIQKTDSFTARR